MNDASAIVTTAEGQLEGSREDGVVVFRGIPYAAPPVGDLRWMRPQPVEPWEGVRPAKVFGPASHQQYATPNAAISNVIIVPFPHSEDCLYLNVWTPALDDAKRPVLFWIHSGGLEMGSGAQPNYDGTSLAKNQDVVVVTINYRLGPLGYLRLKDVTDGAIPSTGNEGRMDEIAALTWVQENIGAFGGDAENVTIFGQSAGSIEVACLLAAVPARGLFRRAILHSTATHTANSIDHANHMTRLFLDVAGCSPDDPGGIRKLGPRALVKASADLLVRMATEDPTLGKMHFNPVIDGEFLPQRPYDAIKDGAADDISVMVGSTLDEVRLGLGSEPPLEFDYEFAHAQLQNFLGDETARIMEAYRKLREQQGLGSTPTDIYFAIETDRVLRFPSLKACEAMNQRGRPGYHYIITYPSPMYDGRMGAPHAVELAPLFGTHDSPLVKPFSGEGESAAVFSRRMQDAWAAFARTGDPSCDSIGQWPVYGDDRETMLIGQTWEVAAAPYDDERLLWEEFPGDPRVGLM